MGFPEAGDPGKMFTQGEKKPGVGSKGEWRAGTESREFLRIQTRSGCGPAEANGILAHP